MRVLELHVTERLAVDIQPKPARVAPTEVKARPQSATPKRRHGEELGDEKLDDDERMFRAPPFACARGPVICTSWQNALPPEWKQCASWSYMFPSAWRLTSSPGLPGWRRQKCRRASRVPRPSADPEMN